MTTTTTPIDLLNTLRREIREGKHDDTIISVGDEEGTIDMLRVLEERLQDWGWDLADLGMASRFIMASIQDRIEAILKN